MTKVSRRMRLTLHPALLLVLLVIAQVVDRVELAAAFQNPAGMILIDHNHMVEALSPETTNHHLHERILPGAPGRRDHFIDPHPLYPLAKLFPVNLVAIPDQRPRSANIGESFNHLSGCARQLSDWQLH